MKFLQEYFRKIVKRFWVILDNKERTQKEISRKFGEILI